MTGVPQKFAGNAWAEAMIGLMGGIEFVRLAHHVAAIVLLLSLERLLPPDLRFISAARAASSSVSRRGARTIGAAAWRVMICAGARGLGSGSRYCTAGCALSARFCLSLSQPSRG